MTDLFVIPLVMSFNNCIRNVASCTAAHIDIYSASQVDNATVDCFLDFHEINEPVSASMKTYPVTLRRSFEFAQSASQYPIKFKSASDFLKVRPQLIVLFKYRRTCLAMAL